MLALAAALAFPLAPRASADSAAHLRLFVESPTSGSELRDAEVFLTGRALRVADGAGDTRPFEIVIAIDTSASTRAASGADVDGDGRTGKARWRWLLGFLQSRLSLPSTDPGDSILAAEVAAIGTLLEQLDPATTRVGLVAFAGGEYGKPDARTVVPLTHVYTDIEAALGTLLASRPAGMTNLAAAVDRAYRDLAEAGGDTRKLTLLMTDGQPTLPRMDEPSYNAQLTLDAAHESGNSGVRIDVFGIGAEATQKPEVNQGVARLTGGTYVAVHHPADLVSTFAGIRLADVATVRIENRTTRRAPDFVHVGADGTFSSTVPLAPGRNFIEVTAVSNDGLEARAGLTVQRDEAGREQLLDDRRRLRRARMLEARLRDERARASNLEASLREKLLEEQRALIERTREERRRLEKRLEIGAAAPDDAGEEEGGHGD
jgi:hypothetical protein